MGKSDFDNLLHVLKVENVFVAGTTVSQEVDFELPRGFIAKITKIKMKFIEMHADLIGLEAQVLEWILTCGLHRDPDEAVVTQIPRDSVQHDGIMDHFMMLHQNANDSAVTTESESILEVEEHIDIITARNMRFNSVAGGDPVASITESIAQCTIYYTLERVTDADILELLDIL